MMKDTASTSVQLGGLSEALRPWDARAIGVPAKAAPRRPHRP
jgi:hypothetical protein